MHSILQLSLRSLVIGMCCVFMGRAQAGNIQITGPTLVSNTGTSALVQFNLSWENSWRGGGVSNWDPAWVFVKYRSIGGIWQHVLLSNTGHTAPAGSMIDTGLLTPGGTPWNATTNPVIGAFVRRNADGNGSFALTGVQLRWDYASQGLAYNDIVQIQVFAIEMVAVMQGAFAAGSGGTEESAFTLTTINTASAIFTPAGSGSLGGQAGGYPTGQTAPANAGWPNGFNAFYAMKYEVSQQGYVDFLNTLTYTQQVTRTTNAPNSVAGTGAMVTGNTYRNGIDIQTPGVDSGTPAVYACNLDADGSYGETVDGTDIACNWLSWGDLTAYLDWCGLRPMTELEFEKACRGPLPPVANEHVWGTTGIAPGPYTLANAGGANETIASNYSSNLGNANYDLAALAIFGPMRTGIFAAHVGNTGRITSGATYYGIMQMGDNVFERPVTIGNVEGRGFTGTHGNGSLLATGNPDATSWPAASTGLGAGLRGGSWNFAIEFMTISTRVNAANTGGSRLPQQGGRGVRSVP